AWQRIAGWSYPDRPRAAGAHSDAIGDGAGHTQHDGRGGRRGAGTRESATADLVRLKYDGGLFSILQNAIRSVHTRISERRFTSALLGGADHASVHHSGTSFVFGAVHC